MTPHRFSSLVLVTALALVVLTGCSKRPTLPEGEEAVLTSQTFSFDEGLYPSRSNLFPEYRIAPGDILDVLFQIQTWEGRENFRIAVDHTVSVKFVHAPELNETQNVQPDGKISLPYIGEFYVVGKTLSELTGELRNNYAAVFRDPEIYVVVPEFSTSIKELKKDLHTAPRGLSRLVTVRPDGFVTFPMAGDVFVAGKTIPEVNTVLNQRYEVYLPGLHVDLFLEKTSGSVVYVLGEVLKPGAYRIDKPITIMEALSLSEGYTREARLESIVVFRRHEGNHLVARTVDLQAALQPAGAATFFHLRPDDIIYVPRSQVSSAAQLMREISDILFFRGWGVTFGGVFWDARE